MNWIWFVLAAIIVIIILLRIGLTQFLRSQIYRSKAPVHSTPADQGLDYEELWIDVGNRRLQAWFVESPEPAASSPALLLFQGGDDVIGELPHLIKYLHDHGFATMCFDYSGNGNSSGQPSAEAFHEDSVAAFQVFESLVEDQPKYLWAFSAGASRLLTLLPEVQDKVEAAFLVGPLASLRLAAADRLPIPKPLLPLLVASIANNKAWIQQVERTPISIIHSMDDEMVPFHHARKLHAAGGDNVELVPVQGLKHNDCWQPINDAYWQPVFERANLN